MNQNYSKWVAAWGNATSITDQKETRYAKNITFRYPLWTPFDGDALRLHFSNLTGTESITITYVTVADKAPGKPIRKRIEKETMKKVTFSGNESVTILPGEEVVSDEISYEVKAGASLSISIYCKDCVQMNAGVLTVGPLSGGFYTYGDYASAEHLPKDLTRNTKWTFFLNTLDIHTKEENYALICYGDSITAQDWPDYLAIRCWENNWKTVSIIRRAVSGTRILRQYDCTTYAAYGLKGKTRFPLEVLNTAGASAVLIQHGINDIIHPVGTEENVFRPWEDLPTVSELIRGTQDLYIKPAKAAGLKVYGGTLVPFYNWRTYEDFREQMKQQYNQWILTGTLPEDYEDLIQGRTKELAHSREEALKRIETPMGTKKTIPEEWFDATVDFASAICDPQKPEAFQEGCDSGDHLHPSKKAYIKMAYAVPKQWLTIGDSPFF